MIAPRILRTLVGTASLVASLVCAPPLSAQEMELPVDVQVSMIARIFAFDRSFEDRVGDELVVGIAYQGRNRESLNAYTAAAASLGSSDFKIGGKSVRLVEIDLESESDVERILKDEGVDMLYITPLRSEDLTTLLQSTNEAGVTTLSGVPGHADNGAAISFGRKASRPEIIVNLETCRILGVNFSSQLLELVRIVEGSPDDP